MLYLCNTPKGGKTLICMLLNENPQYTVRIPITCCNGTLGKLISEMCASSEPLWLFKLCLWQARGFTKFLLQVHNSFDFAFSKCFVYFSESFLFKYSHCFHHSTWQKWIAETLITENKMHLYWLYWTCAVKGIVYPEMKMYSPSGHPRCKWVCFFIRTDLEKCSITSLAH